MERNCKAVVTVLANSASFRQKIMDYWQPIFEQVKRRCGPSSNGAR